MNMPVRIVATAITMMLSVALLTRADYQAVAVGGFGIGAGVATLVATLDQLIRDRKGEAR